MDIFVINKTDADNINPELLAEFGYKRITNPNKFKVHCFSYLMLDRILKEVYKIENREIEFVENKPYLKSKEKFFSLSHSGDYISIGVSDVECGVDIEIIKDRDFLAIAKRMGFSCKNLKEFYLDWTKYEAEYKLGGKYSVDKYGSIIQTELENHMLTAVCTNPQEKFEIYTQNGEKFPKL